MTETYIKLPNDSSNTGKLVRANERVVNGSAVEEHFMILQDYTNDNQASIDSTGHLSIVGSITSMPTIVIGSIVDMPDITVNSPQTLGSWTGMNNGSSFILSSPGSIVVTGSTYVTGSINISTTLLPISGNVLVSGNVNVTQTTNPWIVSGNVLVSGTVFSIPISGTSYSNVVSMPAVVGVSGTLFQNILGSVYVSNQISVNAGSESWIKAGSVIILGSVNTYGAAASLTGSLEVFSSTGSVNVYGSLSTSAGSEQWIKGGSIQTYNPIGIGSMLLVSSAGSVGVYLLSGTQYTTPTSGTSWVNIASGTHYINAIQQSGTNYVNIVNSLGSIFIVPKSGTSYVNTTQTTSPWVTSGTATIAGSAYVTGSIQIATSLPSIGSFTAMALGSVAITNIGSVIQSTSPWIIAGSVNIVNSSQEVGSPCFKQAGTNASGTYTQVWTIGGTGSRLEVHGWHISTNNPGIVTIVGSATTPILISNNFLNYASGALIEKTFSNPIVPQGANVHLGFQTTVAGSTCVTIYGREISI